MTDLAGKGKRVIGTFVFMTGAGVILDSNAGGIGLLILVLGAVLIVWGLVEGRRTLRASATHVSESHGETPS